MTKSGKPRCRIRMRNVSAKERSDNVKKVVDYVIMIGQAHRVERATKGHDDEREDDRTEETSGVNRGGA